MFFFYKAEDGIRAYKVTGVQTCALPILPPDDRVEHPGEDSDVQAPGHPQAAGDVVDRAARLELIDKPEALLRSVERRVGEEWNSDSALCQRYWSITDTVYNQYYSTEHTS